ncbi:Rv1733c family protein [Streptomyces griseofuscus]|uniref:Rv1733c family protein n=1 Tax=Streptomyces griseofuscus TaxID=146922 RepID=UPI00341197AA
MARTPPTTVARVRLWRWRHNPLKRHSDVVEAWIVLVTWALALLGGVLAGVVAAQATDSAFAARRAQVHAVSAVLTDGAAKAPPGGSGYEDGRVWAAVRWTDAVGEVHIGQAKIFPGSPVGSRLTVWTDHTGRIVSPPPSGTGATLQVVLTGVLVAPPAGATVWAGGWLIRTRLLRRRLAEWEEEWEQVGPEWRKRSGGRG